MLASLAVLITLAAEDLPEIQKRGQLRLLVHGGHDYLPRSSDPRAGERALAEQLAKKLGLEAVFVPVAESDDLIPELLAGHGDLVVASLAVTPDRAEKIAFTRPLRMVKQQLVVNAKDDSVKKPEDLAGKEVTVRASSSYAVTLGKTQGVKLKPAKETEDTIDLIQKVGRGEEKMTVADSDILAAAQTFEPNVKAAFDLTEKDEIAWGLRKEAKALKTAVDNFIVESHLTGYQNKVDAQDLDGIKKRGALRVLTRNSSTTFFLYKGEQLGFDYELVKEFAKSLEVRLELIVPATREELLKSLAEGRADLVAAGMTVTPEREKQFAFSRPYQQASELLVVSAKNTAQTLADLKGKKITVRKSSSYFETLSKLKEKNGFEIDLASEDTETEELLDQVSKGQLVATVADSNILEVEMTYDSGVKSLGPLGDIQNVAWVMRKDQPKLKVATDAFVKKNYKGLFYNMTVNKYFKNPKQMRAAASDARSDKEGKLSAYDDLVKKHAKAFAMDWRLVTSQMYQESRFDPAAKSWVGAQGLMQVMPATAKELKVDDVVDPDKGIYAGVKLLTQYAKRFEGPGLKEKDRLRFAIASYNCGPGHVIDARRIAKDMKLDPDKWFGNVEKALLLLAKPEVAKKARHGFCRCTEPVAYVSEIQSRYDAYSKLVPIE